MRSGVKDFFLTITIRGSWAQIHYEQEELYTMYEGGWLEAEIGGKWKRVANHKSKKWNCTRFS